MLNYDEIVIQADEHRNFLLANAEQQRLTQSLVFGQPHSIRAWIGQHLIALGRQLQGEKPLPALTSMGSAK